MLERTRTAVMAGTSTALDVIYELTGRRLPLLQRGAAWLYERAEGDHIDLEPFTQPPQAQAAPAPAAPAPAKAKAAPEPAKAKAEVEAAPEPVEAEPVEAVEAVEAAPAEAEAAPAEAEAAPEEAAFPIEGYDDLSVKPILDALEGLNAAQLQQVLEREDAQKRRVTITRAIKKLMEA